MFKIGKLSSALVAFGVLLAFTAAKAEMTGGRWSHEAEVFAAGQPGDPSKPSRRIEITARESSGAMNFSPAKIEVKKGEQIEFVITNKGELDHEFVIGDKTENAEHAAEMAAMPGMQRADPNAVSMKAGAKARLFWRFTKPGTFEFACLIPGHYAAGMKGSIIVK